MKYLSIIALLISNCVMCQIDFSDQWQDLFSYTEVKDFVVAENKIYAITENAMFIHDIQTQITDKLSSVNGLSGNVTSVVNFDVNTQHILIAYENGLVEVIDQDQNIIPLTGLRDNTIILDKNIHGIASGEDDVYIYGDYGISQVDLNNVEFRASFSLSDSNLNNPVNDLVFVNDAVYAATENGLYACNLSVDFTQFSNWTLIKDVSARSVETVGDKVLFSSGNNLYEVANPDTVVYSNTFDFVNVTADEDNENVVISIFDKVIVLSAENYVVQEEVLFSNAQTHTLTSSSKAVINGGDLYLATDDFGILMTSLTSEDDNFVIGSSYQEIHPEGPLMNTAYSITASDGQVWIPHGGLDYFFLNSSNKNYGVSGLVNGVWNHIPHSVFSARDITKILVDPFDPQILYLSSNNNGIQVLHYNNQEGMNLWENIEDWHFDSTNGGIADGRASEIARMHEMVLDRNQNMWVSQSFAVNLDALSVYNFENESWGEKVNLSNVEFPNYNDGVDFRVAKLYAHTDGNIFAGTRDLGVLVFKDTHQAVEGDANIAVLDQRSTRGALNDGFVRGIAVGQNNRLWIGTTVGLQVFDDYNNIFSNTVQPAQTLIIEENGEARELLTNISINDILVDEANTIWVATNTAGVFHLSSDGQTTFDIFNTVNSPLPSDVVLDLEIDDSTGMMYIVTEQGVVSFQDAETAPIGDQITEVVAYPNPALANNLNHNVVRIVAKNGEGLPEGTNIKILDVSGRLVFEQNIANTGSSAQGSLIQWDKRNLAGEQVVSGIYIVLVSNAEGTEVATTKIAIVN